MRTNQKPDFICVAPHKTGTTWLYVVLKSHPQIWLPPKKELWFFNQMGDSYLERWRKFFNRTGMPGDNRKSFEEDINTRFKQNFFEHKNLADLWWWLRFLFIPYSFSTYPCLFPNDPAKVCGDITPNYYFIKPGLVQQLSQHNPNIKILFILRNPVDRAWSYARMVISNDTPREFKDIEHMEFIKCFDQFHSWWKPYIDRLKIWTQHFQNIYIGYYDMLQENPYELYAQMCDFLGIDSSNRPANLNYIVNRGIPEVLPTNFRIYLSKQYITEVQELVEWSDNPYTRNWLNDMERMILM